MRAGRRAHQCGEEEKSEGESERQKGSKGQRRKIDKAKEQTKQNCAKMQLQEKVEKQAAAVVQD